MVAAVAERDVAIWAKGSITTLFLAMLANMALGSLVPASCDGCLGLNRNLANKINKIK